MCVWYRELAFTFFVCVCTSVYHVCGLMKREGGEKVSERERERERILSYHSGDKRLVYTAHFNSSDRHIDSP